MYSRKSVGPRMALLTPALTGYFCEICHPEPPEAANYCEKKK